MADSGRSSTSSSSSATQSETPEKKNYPGEEEKDSKGAEDCKNMKKTAEKDIKDDRKSRDADQMVKTSQKLDQNDTSGEFKKEPKEKPAKDAAPKQVPSSPPQTPRTPPGTPEPQTPTSADPPQPPRQPENEVFRSNLQVLLKNQNLQKAKSREYLERVEAIEAGTDDYKLNRKKEPKDEVVDCEEVKEDHKMHDKEEKLQQNEKKKRKENKDKVTMEDGKKERRRSKGGEQEAEKKKDKDRKKSTSERREDDKDKKKTKEEEKVKKEEVIKKKEKKENHEEKPKPDERKTENKKRIPTNKEENYAAEKPKKDKAEKENKHAREKLKKVKEETEEKPKKEDKQDSEKPTKEKQDRKAKEDNLKKEKIEERKEEKKNKEIENETKEEEQKIKEKCEKIEKGLKEVDKDGGRLVEEKKREDGSVKKKKDEEKEEEKEEHHLPRVVGQDVKLEGPLYLKRKHHPFRRWKRYYFVLHGQLLTHYRSQQDYQQLSQGVKGSHDLATVLEVKSRSKSGVMIKSRKRFSLTRRNVASIHLAADTEEERSRWMTALEAVQQGSSRRLSELHRSEDVLAAPSTRHSSKPKSSTLPGRTKHTSSSSSSSSSEEDEEEEEQPKLIQPKKVLRVPIVGGGPLVGVNLGQVKLKQVKKEEQGDQQDDLTNETVKSKSSEKETDDEAANTESLKKKSTAAPASPQTGELFGVKLKTLKKAGMELHTQDREGGQQEDASGSQTGQQKRPMKQAVIPLNTSGLLSRPDIHTTTPSPSPSPTPSPSTQKKSTVDRKKSPSPSLPISKSVQALTKSVEVVDDGQQADKATSGVVKENGDSNGALQHSLSINHASTSTLTEDTTVELAPEIKTSESTKEKSESPNKEQDGGEVSIPRVSIILKQDCSQEPEYEELDDLLFPPQTVEQVTAETRDGGKHEEDAKEKSNRKSSSSSSDSCPPPLPTSPIPASPYTSTRSPFTEMSTSESQDKKNVDCENEYEEFDENFLTIVQEAHKQAQVANKKAPVSTTEVSEENKPLSPPRSPYRVRSDTNESQGSSNKSDSEGDKKVKGFKIFQRKRSSSTISKNEEEDGSSRSMKDSVRKSSAITKFLSGKKKDKSKKTENIGSESPTEDHVEVPVKEKEPSVQHTEEEAPVNTSTQDKQDTTTQVLDTKGDEKWSSIDELLVEMRVDNLSINAEARCSSYSRTSTSSREQEPAPSIPEKTRLRAKSPNHDVPQSNRPVTAYHMIAPNSEGEGERPDGQPVDGYISEQQIEAILNKSQTRRASQTNSPGVILTGPDGKKRDAETAEDSISKRPSYVSLTSTESDDPLPMTNFSGDRASISSGSSKERGKLYDSDGSGELVQENDGVKTTQPAQDDATPSASNNSVLLRKPARPTDGLTAGNRLSLTSKEFTVVEEDGSGSPETQKSTLPAKEPDSTQAENKKHEATESDSNSGSDSETGSSNQHSEDEEEKKNYFPTVGVELRQTRKDNLACPAYGADVRTSGIDGLKKCLKEMEEGDGGQDDSDSREIRRGISRLGHSPAMEKLKQTSEDL